jgi:hypothetical protein
MHCPPLAETWIGAMRNGERVMQKARRGFPAGLPAQFFQITIFQYELRYAVKRNFGFAAPPATTLKKRPSNTAQKSGCLRNATPA